MLRLYMTYEFVLECCIQKKFILCIFFHVWNDTCLVVNTEIFSKTKN